MTSLESVYFDGVPFASNGLDLRLFVQYASNLKAFNIIGRIGVDSNCYNIDVEFALKGIERLDWIDYGSPRAFNSILKASTTTLCHLYLTCWDDDDDGNLEELWSLHFPALTSLQLWHMYHLPTEAMQFLLTHSTIEYLSLDWTTNGRSCTRLDHNETIAPELLPNLLELHAHIDNVYLLTGIHSFQRLRVLSTGRIDSEEEEHGRQRLLRYMKRCGGLPALRGLQWSDGESMRDVDSDLALEEWATICPRVERLAGFRFGGVDQWIDPHQDLTGALSLFPQLRQIDMCIESARWLEAISLLASRSPSLTTVIDGPFGHSTSFRGCQLIQYAIERDSTGGLRSITSDEIPWREFAYLDAALWQQRAAGCVRA